MPDSATFSPASQIQTCLLVRYENLIQVRCLLEGVQPDDILANWHSILPDHMSKWQQDRQEVHPYRTAYVVELHHMHADSCTRKIHSSHQ